MKVTEKTSAGETFYVSIPFQRTDDRVVRVIAPKNEEPIQVFLIESGWNYGYPTYHVIIEYGDFEQTDYKFMSADEVSKFLGVSVDEIHQTRSFVLTPEYANRYPNDGELGKRVRQETISPF
jgi:hypothetical protein